MSRIEIDDSPAFVTYKVLRSGDMACPCGRAPLEISRTSPESVLIAATVPVSVLLVKAQPPRADVDDMRRFPLHVVTP